MLTDKLHLNRFFKWKNSYNLKQNTSVALDISSVWLVIKDNIPSCVLTESMSEMLIPLIKAANASLVFDLLFRFVLYKSTFIYWVFFKVFEI